MSWSSPQGFYCLYCHPAALVGLVKFVVISWTVLNRTEAYSRQGQEILAYQWQQGLNWGSNISQSPLKLWIEKKFQADKGLVELLSSTGRLDSSIHLSQQWKNLKMLLWYSDLFCRPFEDSGSYRVVLSWWPAGANGSHFDFNRNSMNILPFWWFFQMEMDEM